MQVFIENEAGSCEKRTYDESSLRLVKTAPVSAPYPFPYGFIPGTRSGDGDAADCFVLTRQALKSGTTVACKPVALLEQIEDGDVDHKVIAVPDGDDDTIDSADEAALRGFVQTVFAHVTGKTMIVGRLLGREAAEDYVRRCQTGRPR
ncbi:MAG: inorganic diphosphatase [Pseudolabrys sp.]